MIWARQSQSWASRWGWSRTLARCHDKVSRVVLLEGLGARCHEKVCTLVLVVVLLLLDLLRCGELLLDLTIQHSGLRCGGRLRCCYLRHLREPQSCGLHDRNRHRRGLFLHREHSAIEAGYTLNTVNFLDALRYKAL